MIRKTIKWIFKITISIFLICWLFSLARCEVLTWKYGHYFETAYFEHPMTGESLDYFKVLRYSDTAAEVYYVAREYTGNILWFEKQNGQWENTGWTVVWSNCGGSASEVIWPYWWHFIYGGL